MIRSSILISTVAAMGLSACTTGPGLFDESDPNRQAKTGAIAGAATGALAGR